MIPTISECLKTMDEYQMLDNIKAHSIAVTKVAFLIASFLSKKGADISIKKVIAGALLHDIGKTESLKTGKDHVEIGVSICIKKGFYEIVDLVSEHVILKYFDENAPYTEKEIIYYSDKRVNHDKIVSLEERLRYIIERYSRGNRIMEHYIRENFALCRRVEKKLFKELPFTPSELSEIAQRIVFDPEKGLIKWK